MRENREKREGLLLARTNRRRERAPKGVVPDDEWVEDGTPVVSLGVPIGNNINEKEWWESKLINVRSRIAMWRSMGRLSIAGRNRLIQSVLYGSLRYWLFSMIIPDSIIEAIEKDVYHIIWASTPGVSRTGQNTKGKSKAYIVKKATFQPENRGGAGAFDLRAHVKAIHAHWVRKYLEPGSHPWKLVVDQWACAPYKCGRGSLLSNFRQSADGSTPIRIPSQARYLRKCFQAFHDVGFRQDTTILDRRVLAESVFYNHRFTVSGQVAARSGQKVDDQHGTARDGRHGRPARVELLR